MTFAERYGYRPARESIQIESMDGPLRNGIWSLLKVMVWDHAQSTSGISPGYYLSEYGNEALRTLCQRLWFSYFKKPLDELGNDWSEVLQTLRRHFFDGPWYEAFDFTEFVASNYENQGGFKKKFCAAVNRQLEQEMSAYRFVDGLITRITEPQEMAEIDEAVDKNRGGPVGQHLRRALELLADRSAPDYRNSIKESISAVESLAARTVKAEKSTLGQLLKRLEEEINLHPALKTAFSNLYGYTSDESGIRHALTEMDRVDFNDAKFMLVVCAAFTNFVNGKLAEG